MTQIAFFVVPGGPGTLAAVQDTAAVDWLREAHETSTIEYDPDPPLDSGPLEKADAETRRRATEHMIAGQDESEVTP